MNETPALPVEVHCHGFGEVDFSEFSQLDLALLDRRSAEEGVVCIPTLYLHRSALEKFEWFMQRYADLRRNGKLPHIPGIALEGPLLASHGGTPRRPSGPPPATSGSAWPGSATSGWSTP